ncbi:MAG: VWA domain-containing protein [Candidatus Staskawiczbacteria bacterium]|nr:VWA domain-containing protein [Candidatus Staskawiczbacteria bacterium]
MNKIFKVIIAGISLIIVAVIVYMVFDFVSSAIKAKNAPNIESPPSEPEIVKSESAYGVSMQKKCFLQYQDFLKNYGQDYSKCLVDFSFSDEYCGGYDPETQALSDENVIVILDASGSMAKENYAGARIDVAKKAVSDFLIKMPQNVNTGLIVYGHKGSNSNADKILSCSGVEEVVKLDRNNNNNIISAMGSFSPMGWTPIAGSLDFVKNIFSQKNKNDKNYLILVSDGVESCDGDPLISAQNLKSDVPGIKISVIGLEVDTETRSLLTKVAMAGGGSYIDANGSAEMARAFNDQLLLIKKDCVNVTLIKMGLEYNSSILNNLDCWLGASKKESEDFTENVEQKYDDAECNQEISDAIVARQTDFWNQKQDLQDENYAAYEQIKEDLNSQLKVLNEQRN